MLASLLSTRRVVAMAGPLPELVSAKHAVHLNRARGVDTVPGARAPTRSV